MVEQIRLSRWRMFAATLGAVAFCLVGAWLTTRGGLAVVAGWLSIVTFGIGAVAGLVGTVWPRVVTTLDDEGVWIGPNLHRWEDIQRVEVGTRSNTKMASLVLRPGVTVRWGRDALPTSTPGGPDGIAERVRNHPGYARRAGAGGADDD